MMLTSEVAKLSPPRLNHTKRKENKLTSEVDKIEPKWMQITQWSNKL